MAFRNLLHILLAGICVSFLLFLSQITGRRLIQLGKFSFQSKLERFIISQAFGLAALAYSIFILGLIGGIQHIIFITLYIIVLPLVFLSDIKTICSKIKYEFLHLKLFSWIKNIPLLSKVALILLVTFVAINFINTLMPPIGRDAMTYHLKMPQYYIQTRYVQPEPPNIHSYFPALVEMLYTFGLILSNDYSSHLIHFYFGILAALTIFMFARRISNIGAALFCALTFYSMPLVSQLSSWAYVDLALCFFTLLAIGFFSFALEDINPKLIKLSAILFGIALGIKYLTLISLYIIIIIFLIRWIKTPSLKRPFLLRQSMYFFTICAVVALPYYVRNILITGNPVYPFFYSIFGGPHWDTQRAILYNIFLRVYGMGYSIIDYLLLPWRMVVYAGLDGPFDGEIGALYLTLAPLLIWFRPKHKSAKYMLMYIILSFFAWANTSQQVRFLLPALGALSICLYAPFECPLKGKIINRCSIRLIAIGLILYNLSFVVLQFQKYQPLAFVSGKINREEFLKKHLRDYEPIQYMNTHLSSNSKTYMVAISNIGYYCKKPFVQESIFDYTFRNIISESTSPQQIASWLRKQGITHLLINEDTAIQYIYPDLDTLHLKRYNIFHNNYLDPVYNNGIVFLYQIKYKDIKTIDNK